jgi:hypothetical protein
MSKPRPLPPALSGAFTYAEGLAGGATPRRLRNPDIASPFRGSRASLVANDVHSLARAYSPLLGPNRYFSHLTAAQLLGLWMPEHFIPESMHVTSVVPARAVRRPQVTGHQSQRSECIVVNGLRVSTPLAAWLECAEYLSVDDLVVMGDSLVRRRSPLTTVDELRAHAASSRGRRGARAIAGAVPLIRENTDSARETILRLVLGRAGFPEPEVNGVITNSFGQTIAHGDLVYRAYRTVLEYEGDHHRTDERQFNIDIERLDELAEEGWRIIRVSKELLRRRATLLGKVDTALRAGGWRSEAR